jgi:D-amino-acid oxidase
MTVVNNPSAATLPSPSFSWDPATRPPIAGLRPHRKKSYRLETVNSGNKFIVHNYGHGGAGITMSWGCAQEVVDLVSSRGFAQNERVAVLGSGVMGLTAATLLAALNLNVTIYAKDFPPHTTSNVAGGQWAPSLVEHNNDQQFNRILRRAFAAHRAKIGQGYGVSTRLNYTLQHSPNFETVPKDVIPDPQFFTHLPFTHLTSSGYAYSTLLVEPPIFLAKLQSDLVARQVPFVPKQFSGDSEVLNLQENIVINCTGLGSRKIWPDPALEAVKGQLVLLPPQPNLQYLYSGHGYLFPRQDAVVVGGSEEYNPTDDLPDIQKCKAILANVKGVFDGSSHLFAAAVIPDWFIQNK